MTSKLLLPKMVEERPDALLVLQDELTYQYRKETADFAIQKSGVVGPVGLDPVRTWPVQRNRGAPYACLREVSSDSMTTGFYPAPSAKVLMSGCHTLNATNAVRSSDLVAGGSQSEKLAGERANAEPVASAFAQLVCAGR